MTNKQEPMIQLQPGGVAPILSYNVPEPTSYSGRNFIDLQIPDSAFVPPTNLASPRALSTMPRDMSAKTVTLPGHSATVRPAALSSKLANLDMGEVRAMAQAGQQLNIYRSLYGTLTYNYIDAEVAAEHAVAAGPMDEPSMGSREALASLPTPPPDPIPTPDPIVLIVDITAPAPGSVLSGPYTGVTFDVTGDAYVESGTGSIATVEVQVGSGGWQPVSLDANGGWILRGVTITRAGALTIGAKATLSTLQTSQRSVTVTVVLAPPPDTTPPGLTITAPLAGQVIAGPASGASVRVEGTASDDRGISKVEVAIDNGAPVLAAPKSGSDWTTWAQLLTVPVGTHALAAKCTDGAGNVTTRSVTVSVTVAPPADTTPPTVTIQTPANGASVNGPFQGATVAVTGTATDAGGVSKVELTVDHNPVFVGVQPKAPGDWSQWSGSLLLTQPGQRAITARCTDRAGNTTETTIMVMVTLLPDVISRLSRLILVESYRLSSYLGNYGAGRTIKTFSLLPGEKTKISIKSYTRNETEAKSASSILDSFTKESAHDFETSMANEQSDRKNYNESFNYKVSAEATASWGWGSAKVSGDISGGTNGAREEFAKNISNSTQKHAAKASAKRDVQINTSYEVKTITEEEVSTEREIENINVSRTLNFVFRQMNQEFITLLHLVDIRIGFYRVSTVNGQDQRTYQEVTLPQLDALLDAVIVPAKRTEVRNAIIKQLTTIFDYQDQLHRFVEEEALKDGNGTIVPLSNYLRVKKDYTSTYVDAATNTKIRVPGIILAANTYVLRTEGVIVEALLGQGDALDDYSHGLQDEAVAERRLANLRAEIEAEKARLALDIIRHKDAEAAKIFVQLYPGAPSQLVLALPQKAHNGQPVQ